MFVNNLSKRNITIDADLRSLTIARINLQFVQQLNIKHRRKTELLHPDQQDY